MVKPLRSAFMAGVVLTEFHHHGYRVLSIWLRMCAADVAWYKPSRYRATIRGGWGLMSPEAGGDAIESLLYGQAPRRGAGTPEFQWFAAFQWS